MTATESTADLQARARNIIKRLAIDCTKGRQTSYMTPSIYNTAWVSMIVKPTDGRSQWLFPECFQFVLDKQMTHGGWQSYEPEQAGVTDISDGIINTIAALLALQTRWTSSFVTGIEKPCDLDKHINKAVLALQSMLQNWDVTSCDYVGFDFIVPAHLQMLQEHGIVFSFPGRRHLMAKQQQKLSKFKPEYLYGETPSTLLYSLEALIGKVDFDRDDDSEKYLRSALSNGAVPEACPFTIFEVNWVVKTLLAGGMTPEVLGLSHLDIIADYLEHTLVQQKGIVGWTPGLIAEADDTSVAIYVLNMLGRPTHPDRLFASFESQDHFRCFALEGNSSLSVNSHVLKTLLHTPDPRLYQDRILKAASFICDCWWNGERFDKWSTTEFYPMMLISQALVSLLALWDQGQLPEIPESFLKDRLRIVVFGLLIFTLKAQTSNGSWGMDSSRETTAYALIVLATTASLPLAAQIGSQLLQAIKAGRHFLLQNCEAWSEPDYIWQAKTAYGSGIFTETYIVAAMNIATPSHTLGRSVERLFELEDGHRNVIFARIIQLPLFSDTPAWLKEAAIIESYLYKPLLKQAGLDVLPLRDFEATRLIEIIPFYLTASSHVKSAEMSPRIIFQMMVSLLILYKIDQHLEAFIVQNEAFEMDDLRQIVNSFFDHSCSIKSQNKKDVDSPDDHTRGFDFSKIQHTLSCFVNWFLQNANVIQSSTFDQRLLRKELRVFLQAQLTSAEESSRLPIADSSSTPTHIFHATETFYDWLHYTSGPHVGGRFVFAFYSCLLGAEQGGLQDCSPSGEAKYFAQELSAHLGVLSRMENDYGSMLRDIKERNLNCVHFPEFAVREDGEEAFVELKVRKAKLRALADFEKDCSVVVLKRMEGLVRPRKMKALKGYCNIGDLVGQIYAVDDISPENSEL